MASSPNQKPNYPPLKCEQLEDRLVLTVHVGPTASLPTEVGPTQLPPNLVTNVMLVHPPLISVGTNLPAAPQGGSVASATSAATSASAAGSASSASSASSAPGVTAASTGGSASGQSASGGPLFASSGVPSITSAGNQNLPGSPVAEGGLFNTLSLAAASVVGSSATLGHDALPSSNGTVSVATATANADEGTSLQGQSPTVTDLKTGTLFIVPTTPTSLTTTNDSSVTTTDKTLTTTTSTLPPLITPSMASTTSSNQEAAPTYVIHSDSTQALDDVTNPDTDAPLN